MITSILKIMAENFLGECTSSMMERAVNAAEEKNKIEKSREKALEGTASEYVETNMDVLIEDVCEKINEADAQFTEEEIRAIFDKYYTENFQNSSVGQEKLLRQEELYKRYKIFVQAYVKKMSESITFGEKRIISKLSSVGESMKKMRIDAEKQTGLLEDLCKDIDIPRIVVSYDDVVVKDYDSKYLATGSMLDFDEEYERDNAYIFTIQIENNGKTDIHEIAIRNLNVYFCMKAPEQPEVGDLELLAIQHEEKQKCKLSILQKSRQKLHLIVKRREEELNDEKLVEIYMTKWEDNLYEEKRLRMEFEAVVTGDKKAEAYVCDISLSEKSMEKDTDITGTYVVDAREIMVVKEE